MSVWMYVLGAAAVAAVVVVGLGTFGGASAENVTLEAPSGAGLVADKTMLLVDIRTPAEWKETGVVEGALLVTYSTPDAFVAAVKPYLKPGQRLGLICRSGNRSSRAAQQVAPLVKGQIVDIAGGMGRILGQGYRPVRPTRKQGCASC
ncbi:rhodanese-like domain-containing protein [Pseudorhodobacter wandonensis]|uniref:rhodanese-like domain-containing protein n=1 Tax=Pseudorhodobacter wandonensis TaxID=1120568 RepID=UPI000A772698|nr:rhodanese-like domain-containing protein [Pseudorhodobacter wandonensis]